MPDNLPQPHERLDATGQLTRDHDELPTRRESTLAKPYWGTPTSKVMRQLQDTVHELCNEQTSRRQPQRGKHTPTEKAHSRGAELATSKSRAVRTRSSTCRHFLCPLTRRFPSLGVGTLVSLLNGDINGRSEHSSGPVGHSQGNTHTHQKKHSSNTPGLESSRLGDGLQPPQDLRCGLNLW